MRFLRLFIFLLLICLVLASQAARFLVVNNPEPADGIVVLAGETDRRPARGLELLRRGMAPHLLFDAEDGEQIYDLKLTEIAQRYANTLPEANHITVCAVRGRSTFAETADVGRCLGPLNARRVLIVTSNYHTRRAFIIFSHRLPQYHWSIAATGDPVSFAWWTNRELAKTAFDEWTKLVWWEVVDRWR